MGHRGAASWTDNVTPKVLLARVSCPRQALICAAADSSSWPARLLFVLLLTLIPGSQLLVYPILWILMAQATEAPDATAWRTPTT
jgi:hypothetical protein